MENIAIIGMGKLGTVLAEKFNSAGFKIKSFDKDTSATTSSETIAEAVKDANIIFLCIPTIVNSLVSKEVTKYCPESSIIISFSKGVSNDGETAAEILSKEIKNDSWAVIGGPMLYDEIKNDCEKNVVAVIGSPKEKVAKTIEKVFKDSKIPAISNYNPFTISFLGVLKNVYSVGAGILVGLDLEENKKIVFIEKVIAEMKIFCENKGINPEIVDNPAGIGDFLTTSTGKTSRNRAVGIEIAKQGKTNMQSEALKAAPFFLERFPFIKEKMPIFFAIAKIIGEKDTPKSIINLV